MHTIALELDPLRPYRIHDPGGEGVVRRSFWLGEVPVALVLRQADAEAPVRAEAWSDRPLEPVAEALLEAGRHAVCAELDLERFHAATAADPAMRALAERLPGLKPLRIPDLWTTLLRSLLSQQISTAAARSIERKLAGRLGHTIQAGDEAVPVLPPPATLLAASTDELRACGLSARKAEYARSLAEHVLDGTLGFERLRRLPLEEVVATMTTVRGVGRWTAECTALFGLGHPDVLPADDLGIRKAIMLLDGGSEMPSPAAVRERGRAWEGWRSVASFYLWRSLEL